MPHSVVRHPIAVGTPVLSPDAVNFFRCRCICSTSIPLDIWYYQCTFRDVLFSKVLFMAIGEYEFLYVFIIIIIIIIIITIDLAHRIDCSFVKFSSFVHVIALSVFSILNHLLFELFYV
jgi:hypothetical protein